MGKKFIRLTNNKLSVLIGDEKEPENTAKSSTRFYEVIVVGDLLCNSKSLNVYTIKHHDDTLFLDLSKFDEIYTRQDDCYKLAAKKEKNTWKFMQ